MKRVINAVIWLFLIIFFGSYILGYRFHPNTAPERQIAPITSEFVQAYGDRNAIKEDWFSALRGVVDKTKDPQAQAVLKALDRDGVTALPTDTGSEIIGAFQKTNELKIIPLVPNDKKLTVWKDIIGNNTFTAAFFEEIPAVILKARAPVSQTFKGIALGHEGNHWILFLERNAPISSEQEFCFEEKNTHEFEQRLLAKIGGAPYEQLMNREVDRIYSQAQKMGKKPGSEVPTPADDYSAFNAIFGPSVSPVEDNIRSTSFWVDATFRFIDKYYDGDKEMQKALFLRSAYYTLGILPQKGLK